MTDQPRDVEVGPRRFRFTLRTRLALAYSGLVLAVAAAVLLVTYLVMRYLPDYQLAQPAAPVTAKSASGASENFSSSALAGIGVTTIRSKGDVLRVLLLSSAGVLILLGAVGAWVGWLITARVLRPLHSITDAAARAATGSLDHRIGLSGPDDELTRLSATFDRMLDRLQDSFLTYRRFAADASHELRTPLATTQAMLDVALAAPEEVDVVPLARRLREVNRRSSDIVDALLDLADIDHTDLQLEPVDLEAVVIDAGHDAMEEAELHQVSLRIDASPAVVSGDSRLLRSMIVNLLRNAVRHNRVGGSVQVAVRTEHDVAVLCVTNTGQALTTADVQSLRRPFLRGARRTGNRGHGLGLPLIDAIAGAHTAAVIITPNAAGGGLSVAVTFPRGPAAPPR